MSRSTWACELKCMRSLFRCLFRWSRSTWACELKLCHCEQWPYIQSVTLHVSVWVEIPLSELESLIAAGHAPRERVSWNEKGVDADGNAIVTLHVSVWVEILSMIDIAYSVLSRSTWACELKYHQWVYKHSRKRHAPRERVSWNIHISSQFTPRLVTLHVSVWVEIWLLS